MQFKVVCNGNNMVWENLGFRIRSSSLNPYSMTCSKLLNYENDDDDDNTNNYEEEETNLSESVYTCSGLSLLHLGVNFSYQPYDQPHFMNEETK